MMVPVGGDIHHVDVLALAQRLVAILARINVGGGHAGLAKIFLAVLGTLLT